MSPLSVPTALKYTVAVVALGLFTLSGCRISLESDPATTVTIKVNGKLDSAAKDKMKEELKDLTDGSSHSMSTMSSGDSTTINLSPVTDVEAFSKSIKFGTVTKVDGRTVHVDVAQ